MSKELLKTLFFFFVSNLLSFLVVTYAFASIGRATKTDSPMTFERLVDLINRKKLGTTEEVIRALPENFRGKFALVDESGSLQEASPSYPGAILFDRVGQFILAFNGDPAQSHFDSLEIQQYRVDKKTDEFRTISFSHRRPSISKPNPSECLACHNRDPGPIFGNYDGWLGFYAGDTSKLTKLKNHQRYGALLSVNHLESTDQLGEFIGEINADRILNRILKSQVYPKLRFSILAWFANCREIDPVLQKALLVMLKKTYPQSVYPRIYSDLDLYVLPEEPREENPMYDFKIAFLLEKVVTGLDVWRWDAGLLPGPNNKGSIFANERLFMGHANIDETIGARLLVEENIISPPKPSPNGDFGIGDRSANWLAEYLSDYFDKYHKPGIEACRWLLPKAKGELKDILQ